MSNIKSSIKALCKKFKAFVYIKLSSFKVDFFRSRCLPHLLAQHLESKCEKIDFEVETPSVKNEASTVIDIKYMRCFFSLHELTERKSTEIIESSWGSLLRRDFSANTRYEEVLISMFATGEELLPCLPLPNYM